MKKYITGVMPKISPLGNRLKKILGCLSYLGHFSFSHSNSLKNLRHAQQAVVCYSQLFSTAILSSDQEVVEAASLAAASTSLIASGLLAMHENPAIAILLPIAASAAAFGITVAGMAGVSLKNLSQAQTQNSAKKPTSI